MSCIRFNTPAQRAAMRAAAPRMSSEEDAARIAAEHPAPAVTQSKLRRLRILAADANPKIRESVASSSHAPADLLEALAHDSDEGVRCCVARNQVVPCNVLRSLAQDASESVRGWVAVNFFVPADAMELLAHDDSATVRSLVAWKASLVQPSLS